MREKHAIEAQKRIDEAKKAQIEALKKRQEVESGLQSPGKQMPVISSMESDWNTLMIYLSDITIALWGLGFRV